jgi:hypothetical protein
VRLVPSCTVVPDAASELAGPAAAEPTCSPPRAAASTAAMPGTLVFSYGSNSLTQLRLRVHNPRLTARPASLPGYARVFCLKSASWDGGGVASLAPINDPSATAARGSVVELSPAELGALDSFEGGYRKEHLVADVAGVATPVVAYVAGAAGCGAAWTPPMDTPPSEMYLNAVRIHLREQWPAAECDALAIASCMPCGRVQHHSDWVYPGRRALGIEALLVEINYERRDPWVDGGPARKTQAVACAAKLRAVGVTGADSLGRALREGGGLNSRLRLGGFKAVSEGALVAMRAVCGVDEP